MESGKAAVMVAEILVECGRGLGSQEEVQSLWGVSKLEWTQLGVNSEDVPEFLTKQVRETTPHSVQLCMMLCPSAVPPVSTPNTCPSNPRLLSTVIRADFQY